MPSKISNAKHLIHVFHLNAGDFQVLDNMGTKLDEDDEDCNNLTEIMDE